MFYESQVYKNYISRLNKKIAEWKNSSNGGIKLAIYGAGEHTEMILKNASWDGFKIEYVIDRSVLRQKDGFCGYKVIPPDSLKSPLYKRGGGGDFDAILISSFTYQEEIYSELIGMRLNGVKIIRLYTDEDILKSIKERYACKESRVESRESRVKKLSITDSQLPTPDSRLNVLLIHPPFAIGNQRHKKILPMNMLYLSAYITDKFPDVSVEIMDGQIKNLCLDEMYEKIMEKKRDIIGIGYWTAQAPIAFKLSKFIKENTDALLIHGGVHPTICPEDAVNYCDYAVMYEGEETFCEIIRTIMKNSPYSPFIKGGRGLSPLAKGELRGINGIAYKENGNVKINTPRSYIKDLDSMPFPKWELAGDIKQYNSPMHVTGGLRLPLIGSRGCPYTCTFCSSPLMWERKVRWRKPEKIVDEMEEAIRKFNINQFHFWDDNLMMKKGHIIELCNEIIKRGLKVNWCGLTRASHVIKHKDVLPLMKEAGCVGMEIGIESFTEDSTELVRKGEGTGEMSEASMELERAGIAPLYTHMLFNPGETITGYYQKQVFLDEVNRKNTAFLADSRLGQASTPHRKTDFERDAKELGEVFINDLSNYIHQRINFIPHSLLNDIPVKTKENRGSPIKFLEVTLQAIFDWTEDMIDNYVRTANLLWDKIDGKKSIKELAGEIKGLLKLSDYHSKMFVSLAIVGLAREGAIKSSTTDLHRQKNENI